MIGNSNVVVLDIPKLISLELLKKWGASGRHLAAFSERFVEPVDLGYLSDYLVDAGHVTFCRWLWKMCSLDDTYKSLTTFTSRGDNVDLILNSHCTVRLGSNCSAGTDVRCTIHVEDECLVAAGEYSTIIGEKDCTLSGGAYSYISGGQGSRLKGGLGSELRFRWDDTDMGKDGGFREIVVDGITTLPNVYYTYVGGRVVEVKE